MSSASADRAQFVLAVESDNAQKHSLPKYFCTYGNEAQAKDVFIWEAARATTAAPGFFASVSINGVNHSDGKHSPCRTTINAPFPYAGSARRTATHVLCVGLGFNDSAEQLELELRHVFIPQPIKVLVSLRTGHVNPISMNLSKKAKEHPFGKLSTAWRLRNALVHLVTNTEAAHARLGLHYQDSQNYLRFNVGGGLGSQVLNEWGKIPHIVSRTQDYLRLWKTRQAIKRAAGMLVLTEADVILEDNSLVEPDLQCGDNVDGFALTAETVAAVSAVLQGLAMTTLAIFVRVNPQLLNGNHMAEQSPPPVQHWQWC